MASATPNESGETALTAFSTSDGGENWQKSSLGGPNLATLYLGYQWTFGPKKSRAK